MITKTTKTKPLIHRVEIRNFKCLRSVDVDLEPLTVLIGKNDTGKSSFLQAIEALASEKNTLNLDGVVTHAAAVDSVSVQLMTLVGKRFLVHRPHHGAHVKDSGNTGLGNRAIARRYVLDPEHLRKPSQVGVLGDQPLPPRGENLSAAFDRLPLSRMNELQKELVSRIPTIREVVPVSPAVGTKSIAFDLKSGGRIQAADVSDGVMLLLAFLVIIHDENAPRVLMIEEPENGIHPKQLEYLVKQLHQLTEREDPIQIILTTHSPYILDFVPKESVRVFARTESGDVVVKPFADLKSVADMLSSGFTLGEAWYNSDENELIRESGTA